MAPLRKPCLVALSVSRVIIKSGIGTILNWSLVQTEPVPMMYIYTLPVRFLFDSRAMHPLFMSSFLPVNCSMGLTYSNTSAIQIGVSSWIAPSPSLVTSWTSKLRDLTLSRNSSNAFFTVSVDLSFQWAISVSPRGWSLARRKTIPFKKNRSTCDRCYRIVAGGWLFSTVLFARWTSDCKRWMRDSLNMVMAPLWASSASPRASVRSLWPHRVTSLVCAFRIVTASDALRSPTRASHTLFSSGSSSSSSNSASSSPSSEHSRG